MVLESPTPREKNRFKSLQTQGLLPSEALKKIETERRLGIIPEEPTRQFPLGITKENWWFYGAMGLIGAGILYIYVKSPSATPASATRTVSLNSPELKSDKTEIQELDTLPSDYIIIEY